MSLAYDPLTGGWTFDTPAGPRLLSNLDGPPSGRQLLWLCAHGLLELRDVPGPPVTKLAAARAIDEAKEGEA